jgi:hypothetical protein
MIKDNPKHIQAMKSGKVPFEMIPMGPMAAVARVLAGGAAKYGVRNWLKDSILASTYEGAIGRHTYLEWAAGIDVDKDSGEHPLAHVIASCLIVMDAEANGMLVDDRDRCESIDQGGGDDKS